jgi:hypothetical protein
VPPSGHSEATGRSSTSSQSTAVQASDPQHAETGKEARKGQDPEGNAEAKMEDHVFQTIFLDKEGSSDLWTIDQIPKEKRIYEKWWKQQSHRAQHYYKVVPWMQFLNGKNHTQFAGAWYDYSLMKLGRMVADHQDHSEYARACCDIRILGSVQARS